MTVITPIYTFPNVTWWAKALNADVVLLDSYEHFDKMTFRNRYRISGSNNSVLLSVPLVNGRNQHIPMKDVLIYNGEKWQVQHWRTITSVYRRSPFFEHYEAGLRALFETEYTHLVDFNRAGIAWVRKQLKLQFDMQETTVFKKEYPEDVMDIRFVKPKEENNGDFPKYYQVFEDRIGFQPNLSILDLLFSEGPEAVNLLKG